MRYALQSNQNVRPCVGYTQGIQFHRECGLIMIGFMQFVFSDARDAEGVVVSLITL